tara:strand:- start:820 stop:2133 length:1314 start_codon:yes stop_codon:yes gene_type:complete
MSKSTQVVIPDIGDFSNVAIIDLLVSTGDVVETNDPLVTLESDKAAMDIPAPFPGVVSQIQVKVGDRVSKGTSILLMEQPSADAKSEPANKTSHDPQSIDSPTTKSELQSTNKHQENTLNETNDRPAFHSESVGTQTRPPHASPSVRKLARELGVNLLDIKVGSGKNNRILTDDVQQFVKNELSKPPRAPQTDQSGQMIDTDYSQWGDIEKISLTRIQKVAASHVTRSWTSIPHVTHHEEIDITALDDFRKSMNNEIATQGTRLTILPFVMKAVCTALIKFPRFNSTLANDPKELILKKYFHVGFAVDTEKGLMVPVIKDIDKKGVAEIARELADISKRARSGRIRPEELQGGCFTISSLGGIGGEAFTPIINIPEVAILGLSKAKIKPIWTNTEFKPRLILPTDLSYDHRVIDGASAARFLTFLQKQLEDVRRILL